MPVFHPLPFPEARAPRGASADTARAGGRGVDKSSRACGLRLEVPASWETWALGPRSGPSCNRNREPLQERPGLRPGSRCPSPPQDGRALTSRHTWAQRRALLWGRRHGSSLTPAHLPTYDLHRAPASPASPVSSVASGHAGTHMHTPCMYLLTTLCTRACTPYPPRCVHTHVDRCTMHTACVHVCAHAQCRVHTGAAAGAQWGLQPPGNLSPGVTFHRSRPCPHFN